MRRFPSQEVKDFLRDTADGTASTEELTTAALVRVEQFRGRKCTPLECTVIEETVRLYKDMEVRVWVRTLRPTGAPATARHRVAVLSFGRLPEGQWRCRFSAPQPASDGEEERQSAVRGGGARAWEMLAGERSGGENRQDWLWV